MDRALRIASASKWSGCSWVIMTAVASFKAAAALLKVPGSMTRVAPSLFSLMHEWPSLVKRIRASSLMNTNSAARNTGADRGWPLAMPQAGELTRPAPEPARR